MEVEHDPVGAHAAADVPGRIQAHADGAQRGAVGVAGRRPQRRDDGHLAAALVLPGDGELAADGRVAEVGLGVEDEEDGGWVDVGPAALAVALHAVAAVAACGKEGGERKKCEFGFEKKSQG